MNILLTGATGFLGTRLLQELLAAGHRVTCAGRRAPDTAHPRCTWLQLDFATTTAPVWLAHLRDMDAVVNLVGIFREQGEASFEALHVRGPQALFTACVTAGVQRVVQVSALGADARAETAYHRSKHEADRHLLSLPLDAGVAQPSLVFGPDGASSQRFLTLAALPVIPLPAGGRQRVQPIHVDDAAEALREMVEAPAGQLRGRRWALVGPRPLMLRDYLMLLRHAMGLPVPAPRLPVPAPLVGLLARVGDHLPGALLDRAAWSMLKRGNTADPAAVAAILARPPRPVGDFITPEQREPVRTLALLGWLLPLLRLSLAAVWIITGLVSLWGYPVADSHALLGRAGVPAELQPAALWGAALLDLALGLLTLAAWRWRGLWLAQAGLMLFYSAVIALRLPEFWLHPYGPMLKNLPMLAVLMLLWQLSPQPVRR